MSVPTIVIVGAGYAGVLAANRIAGGVGKRARIVLISERDELVHRVRLHEVAAGVRTRRYPLAAIVHRRVERVRARVARIAADARVLTLVEDGVPRLLAYDHLVYAVGSRIADAAPGAREHAGALAGPDAAEAFAARVRALPAGARVVVVGAGLTGIETAAELAEAHPRLAVTLIGSLATGLDDATRAALRAELDGLGVELRGDLRIAEVRADELVLAAGARLAADAIVWAAGFEAATLARDSGLPVDASGRLVVDATLRVPDHPEIVGCGDAVAVPDACFGSDAGRARMSCAAAMPMGAHAADVVIDAVRGRAPRSFHLDWFVQCLSLGRRRGLLVFVDRDDRPTGRRFDGRRGALAKELICRFVIGSLHLERRLPGWYWWPGRGRRQRALPDAAPRALVAAPDAGDTRSA